MSDRVLRTIQAGLAATAFSMLMFNQVLGSWAWLGVPMAIAVVVIGAWRQAR